ncbi:hypothetical protein [Alteromonas lipolytica]|uniref:hypothetical protein n=1 Tax=Alteromonas lipolytica TaxID=1856405 RepID=UPI0011131766|nr:hypothetical protein [Alteromonas lipolytica]
MTSGGLLKSAWAETFYCSALAIEGDTYYFSPVFEGNSENLECYTNALDEHLEGKGDYSFSPSCMFEDEKAMLVDYYQADIADSKAIFGKVRILNWLPSCADNSSL